MIVVTEYDANGNVVNTITLPDSASRTAALGAISRNQTFLAIPTVTTAQAVAQVQALTRQMNAVINALTSTDFS